MSHRHAQRTLNESQNEAIDQSNMRWLFLFNNDIHYNSKYDLTENSLSLVYSGDDFLRRFYRLYLQQTDQYKIQ